MKKIFKEWEPTILLFLFTYLIIALLQKIQMPLISVLVVLSAIYVSIDLAFQNNKIAKSYYFDCIMLFTFLLGVSLFGFIACSDSVEYFALMSVAVFCSIIMYIIHSIVSRTNLIKRTNEQFEFLSKSYFCIKFLESNNLSSELIQKVKKKFEKLIYEYYYKNNENEDLKDIVEIIETDFLIQNYSQVKSCTSLIRHTLEDKINSLYKGTKYKEKLENLTKCGYDISLI